MALTVQKLCAIHQPNFFPWLGYFDKIRRAQVFVFLDQVDYPRSGSGGMGSYVNRVKIAVRGQPHNVGAPIRRISLGTPINHIMIDEQQRWRTKFVRTLAANYARSKNFKHAMEIIQPLVHYPESNLAAFNIHAIKTIAAALGYSDVRFVRQSELGGVRGRATELLINLTRAAGCNAYLSGGGSAGYQNDEMFAEAGVKLVYQSFAPSPYGDAGGFVPGLSVIDYIMHECRALKTNTELY
ncbi:MAG: hypothetical protein A49_05640 [Methyloceanibacter sp.]|nr:MAG: hypothetical protein A49_05640 [Methyloceanibacter sp.]